MDDGEEIDVFKLLLHALARMMTTFDVHRLKRELVGHLSKDRLRPVKTGKDLIMLLTENCFLNENKLMFFKKILNDASLYELERILMEYIARKSNAQSSLMEDAKKLVDNKTLNRLDDLEKAIQRQYVAKDYKYSQLQCEQEELARKGMTIDVISCSIVYQEERLQEILARKKNREIETKKYMHLHEEVLMLISQNESQRTKLIEEIATKETELKKLDGGGRKKNNGRKNSIFDMVFSPPSIEKLSQVISKLRKDILNVAKERERMEYKLEHIDTRQDRHKDALRLINVERVAKVTEIVELEKKLIKAKENYREQGRIVNSIELEIMELQGAMEENEMEKQQTNDHGLHSSSEFLMKAYANIQRKIEEQEFQVLEYDDIDELKSFTFGESGSRLSPLQFSKPTSVVFNNKMELLILDTGNQRVVITDLLGRVCRDPIQLGDIFKAVDMTMNHKGELILISAALVKVLTNEGDLLFQFLPELADSSEKLPDLTGVAVNINNDIFLCDSANEKIQCFSEKGMFKNFIKLDDSFYSPCKLAVIGTSELVVSDAVDDNLKVMEISTRLFTKSRPVGHGGVCLGEFISPSGLALDRDNNVLVVDSGNHRVQVLNARKKVIASFGRLGSRPGCLDTPTGVAVHPFGIVAVADSQNNRIVLFS